MYSPYFPQNTDLTHLIYGTQPGFFVRSGNTQSEERGFNVNVFAPHDTHVEDNLPVMVSAMASSFISYFWILDLHEH